VGATANLGAVGNVKITGGTIGQILSTDGAGNLSWTSDTTTYGNSNVVTLLSAFGSNTITTTGNISGGNLVTGGQVVSTGNVSSGTGLSTGGFLSVDGNTDLHNTTVTGNLSATGNITANNLGNITTINLTGSNANVLYGNGVFAPVSGAGGLPLANGNSNFNIATANGNATVTTAGTQTWTFDTTGNVTIPGSIIGSSTINIDNRASGNGADINLYSADDITLQARDRDIGSTSEGGDINIFAGDSAEDSDESGGDIVIEAGRGGASNIDYGGTGGFVSVSAGQGGNAVGANFAARPGGSLTLNAGNAGANNGNIDLGNTGGDVTINAGDTTSNGDPGGSIILRSGDAGANALAGQIQLIISSSDNGDGGTWIFDGAGIIQLPNSGTIGNEGNNIDIGSTSAISLEASSAVNIYTDTGTNAWQWQFQDDGNLRLPTIELDVGNTINEQTVIQSQRKIIPGLRYSAEINGTTPTVVYTATSVDTTSMKVTMQIQHTGLGMEFFDVSATSTGGNTYYTVSNRLQPPTITDSTVVVDLNGSNTMDITVTINSGAANSWVTYDATEFGIAVD
jgi:filamentous hemagglutinin